MADLFLEDVWLDAVDGEGDPARRHDAHPDAREVGMLDAQRVKVLTAQQRLSGEALTFELLDQGLGFRLRVDADRVELLVVEERTLVLSCGARAQGRGAAEHQASRIPAEPGVRPAP